MPKYPIEGKEEEEHTKALAPSDVTAGIHSQDVRQHRPATADAAAAAAANGSFH